ncbi:hypothetical protein M3J50_26480, partial [Enterobacter hormaechei]|nr:hypothetical protein [Enterobacter hormaechei]
PLSSSSSKLPPLPVVVQSSSVGAQSSPSSLRSAGASLSLPSLPSLAALLSLLSLVFSSAAMAQAVDHYEYEKDRIYPVRTGLGLTICQGMVGAHGGSVQALPGRDGRGTLIRITLPLLKPASHDEPDSD